MARRLWLHIGMHKTGSSSIQAAMQGYDDGRIAYLDWPEANHSLLMGCAFRETRIEQQVERGFARDAAEYLAVAAVLREQLAERLAKGQRDIVISAEDMSAGFAAADVRRLLDFMARYFDEVKVIAYVREAQSYVLSAFQEIQKERGVPFRPTALLPVYAQRFAPWEEVLGAGQMIYVPFLHDALQGGDVVTDFAARVGLAALARDVRANVTQSAEAVALTYVLWRLPFVAQARRAALVRRWRGRLERFGRHRLALTAAAEAEVERLVAQDRRWMEARLGRALLPDPPLRDDRRVIRVGSAAGLWWLALRSALPLALWLARTGRWRQ